MPQGFGGIGMPVPPPDPEAVRQWLEQEIQDRTRQLACDLLLTYAGTTGMHPEKAEVQTCVRAARWLMEEWRNPTPDPPAPSFSEQ